MGRRWFCNEPAPWAEKLKTFVSFKSVLIAQRIPSSRPDCGRDEGRDEGRDGGRDESRDESRDEGGNGDGERSNGDEHNVSSSRCEGSST